MRGAASLLVPIKLSALCVSLSDVQSGMKLGKIATEFQNLATQPYLGASVVPPAFAEESVPAGIHLHWALPDALTRSDASKGKDGLREVPNRFLVVRFAVADDASALLERMAWVLESDHIWPLEDGHAREADPRNALSRTVPLVYTNQLDFLSKPTYAYQGRVRALDERWREESTARQQPFTALGYGTEAYAAAYPHCRNVFGFFDPCNDAGEAPDGLASRHRYLSYLVVGWYADASLDPVHLIRSAYAELKDEALADAVANGLAADYHWSYRAQDRSHGPSSSPTDHRPVGRRCPERSLFVGQLTQIEWTPGQTQAPRHDEPVTVALGTTISEALSALLASTQGSAPEVETLLNDLQLDLLSEYGSAAGQSSLADARHLRDFAPIPAGHVDVRDSGRIWIVKRADAKGQEGQAPGSRPDRLSDLGEGLGEVKLPPHLGSALRTLNHAQAAFDELAAALATRRGQLFADWTTYLAAKNDPAKDYLELEIKALDGLRQELRDSLKARDDARAVMLDRLAATAAAPTASGQAAPAEAAYELDTLVAPRFYQPNDPVILLSGVNPSSRYGGDGRFDSGKQLVCRLSDEITTWGHPLRKMSPGARTRLDDLMKEGHWASFIGPALPGPKDLMALCVEACLLNPWLDRHLGNSGFAAWQQAYFRGGREEFKGMPPSVIGLTVYEPPWIPLMLQWQTSFCPFPQGAGSAHVAVSYPALWGVQDFALTSGGPDIHYTGANPGFPLPGLTHYEGTVTLTNNVQLNLTAQIDRYLDSHPADAATDTTATVQLRGALQAVRQLPFRMMAQSMDGLHQQMLMRSSTLQMPVMDPPHVVINSRQDLTPAIQSAFKLSNFVREAVQTQRHAAHRNDPRQFHPLRAGVLKITRLRLIDAFGQFRDLIAPEPSPGAVQADSVILANRLKAPAAWKQDAAAVLPLRIAQPARLSFRYRSAGEQHGAPASAAEREMSSDTASSPVFGWILHNRFDHALALYDETGRPIGSFNLKGLTWQEAPGANKGVANRLLLEFMQHLGGGAVADRSAVPRAFLAALIDTIDRAVTGVDVDGYQQDQGLAVLIGRPLALVQADLRLDLYGSILGDSHRQAGLPAIDQSSDAFMLAVARSKVRAAEASVYRERARRSANIESVRFPVRLGDDDKVHDGLVGYFVQQGEPAATYRTFYAPSAQAANGHPQIVKPPLIGAASLSLAAADAAPTTVIMLVDPRAPIHATTGILPVKSITLPPQQYAEALKRIDATFLVAPVLSGAAGVALPVPAEVGHAWSWLTREADEALFDNKGAGVRKWATQELVESPNTRAAFSAPPLRLSEGWLRLYPSVARPEMATGQTQAPVPSPYAVTLQPNAAGDLILNPETATLHGHEITVAEVDDGTRFIGYWRNADDEAAWKVKAHGGYGVDIRCSAPYDSQFDIEVLDAAGQILWTQRHRVQGAGWAQIQRPQVATWRDGAEWIDAVPMVWFGMEPGSFELRVKPARSLRLPGTLLAVDRSWNAINLWSLRLSKLVESSGADIRLWAWAATLNGEQIRHQNIPGAMGPEGAYIGNWTSAKDYVTWRVRLGVGAWRLLLNKHHIGVSEADDVACQLAVEVRLLSSGALLASCQVTFPRGLHCLDAGDLATEEAGEYELRVNLLEGAIKLDAVVLEAARVVANEGGALLLSAETASILNAEAGGITKAVGAQGQQELQLTATAKPIAACASWTIDLGDQPVAKIDLDICYSTQHADAQLVIEGHELNNPSALASVDLSCEATGGLGVFRTQSFLALQLMLTHPKNGRYQLRIRMKTPGNGAPIHIQSVTMLVP